MAFSEMLNIDIDFRNKAKYSDKLFYFLDNCIWIDNCKLSLLQGRCLWSGVNMLTKKPNILVINKRHIFQLHFPQGDEKIW